MKLTAKAYILGLAFMNLFCYSTTKAQVTIGNGSPPVSGALLQLKENDNTEENASKGLILPRVYLSDKNNLFPMFADPGNNNIPNANYSNPTYKSEQDKLHMGLIIYNTNPNAPFREGIFVWNGQEWLPIPESI